MLTPKNIFPRRTKSPTRRNKTPHRVPDHHPGVTPPPACGPSVRPSSFRRASSFRHFRDAAKMIPVPISRPLAFLFPRTPPPACAFHIFCPPSIFSPGPAGNEKNASRLINFCALEPAKVLVCAGRTRRRAGGGYRRGCIAINGGEEKSRAFGIFAGGRVCLAGALLVLAALAGGAWSLPGWRCWRPAACLAHGRARLFGSLALVLVLFIGWRLWPAPGRYTPPPVSYPSRRTRPTPPRLAPAPARACPSCRRAPVPPSPDGPPKIATARRRGYLPRPVSSPGKLC